MAKYLKKQKRKKGKSQQLLGLPKKTMLLGDKDEVWQWSINQDMDVVVKPIGRSFIELDNTVTESQGVELFFNCDMPPLIVEREEEELIFVKDDMFPLTRDVQIPHSVGKRHRISNPSVYSKDHRGLLPTLPNLVYEDYPLLRPLKATSKSNEISRDAFVKNYLEKFFKALRRGIDMSPDSAEMCFIDISTTQKCPEILDPCALDLNMYLMMIHDMIWHPMVDIYSLLVYLDKKMLEAFVKGSRFPPESPTLSPRCPVNMKPIGVLCDTEFEWGIFDDKDALINRLLCHVEICELGLAIAEGYELCMGSKGEFKGKVAGAEFTKRDNFMKKFHKCVSICLSSHTRKFIMMDYNWCGCFIIDDVLDGEIEDVSKLLSNVKTRHFTFSNFNNDTVLTMRNVIGAFLYETPGQSIEDSKFMAKLNKKVSKEWAEFNSMDRSNLVLSHDGQRIKRFKPSSITYTTSNGLDFEKYKVDLDRSMVGIIAVGPQWSCQTLIVDGAKLFVDQDHNQSKPGNSLLSIYDEYYQGSTALMSVRHPSTPMYKMSNAHVDGVLELKTNALDLIQRWSTNVLAYLKLSELYGDCIGRVLKYGYLEDVSSNADTLHFRADGYFIMYEPITEVNDDLLPVDTHSKEHYEMALQTLQRIHSHGVTFRPNISIGDDILKLAHGKVYVINLEMCSLSTNANDRRRDVADLQRAFNVKHSV